MIYGSSGYKPDKAKCVAQHFALAWLGQLVYCE
jgi:hypothetical protein